MSKYIAPEFERPASPKFRSCADNFARRGNPWMTERQSAKEYPQDVKVVTTRRVLTPLEEIRQKLIDINNKTPLPKMISIPRFDVKEVPLEDPEHDMWDKAGRAPVKVVAPTKDRKDTRNPLAMKLIGIGRRAHRNVNNRKVVI